MTKMSTENPYHPFVPPFRYAEEHDAILDSLSRKVGKLSGAGKLGIDVEDHKDARAIRIRIGTRLAEMMNRDCEGELTRLRAGREGLLGALKRIVERVQEPLASRDVEAIAEAAIAAAEEGKV